MQNAKARTWSGSSVSKSGRGSKSSRHEPDASSFAGIRTLSDRSPKASAPDRRSPRSPGSSSEKNRLMRISELETHVGRLQDDLRKAKAELSSSEACKRQAQQEAEDCKRRLHAFGAELEDLRQQLYFSSAAEEEWLRELRQISRERQSETVLAEPSDCNESRELLMVRQELEAALATIERLEACVAERRSAEVEAREAAEQYRRRMDAAEAAAESLQKESTEFRQQLSQKLLELQDDNEPDMKPSEPISADLLLEKSINEITELKSVLLRKDSEMQCTLMDLERNKSEMESTLASKDAEIKQVLANYEKLKLDTERTAAEMESAMSIKDAEMKQILMEREVLKMQVERAKAEMDLKVVAAVAELELAKAAEQEVRMRLGCITEEADRCSRRAARAAEQVEAVQTRSSEMEVELRRLRVQLDQWRKAAEVAVAALSSEKSMERTGSMDFTRRRVIGSPYSDVLTAGDDSSPVRKGSGGGMLRRVSGLWRKSPSFK